MTKHIMIDTETWGKRAGCDARSIGAVVFDPTTGHVATRGSAGTFYTALENRVDFPYEWGDRPGQPPRKYKLWRDPETEAWWSEQSEEAHAAFNGAIDLRDGLILFTNWFDSIAMGNPLPNQQADVRLWGHGAGFDLPIIEAWYHACDLPVPWHYRAPRDTRTAFDMAGIDDHSAWLNRHVEPGAIYHHALDDALCQARAVNGAHRIVQRWRNTSYSDDALPSYLNNIVAAIDDEGDRAFFGSTNDADHLKQIAADLDADRFERDAFPD